VAATLTPAAVAGAINPAQVAAAAQAARNLEGGFQAGT